MRSDAKASTAGSNQGRAKRKPALLLVALAASLAALALVVGPASGSTTRFLQEVFGSAAEPSFPADRGMAVDQGTGELHVIDSTEDVLYRFNADGTPANFSALGTNVIDGEGAEDETAHGHLAFSSNRQREQVALDESGEATDGNIYLTQSEADVIDIFNSAGEYLGELSESTAGGAFGEPCGVAVDSEGTVYVGDRIDDLIHVFEPEALAAAPANADNTASYATVADPCTLAAGAGATEGFLFVNTSFGAALSKLDAATGEVKYQIASGASTVSVDPATGHVFAARNTFSSSSVDEYDASGAAEATLVSSFKPGSTVEGVAVDSAAEEVYVARSSTNNVEVYGPAKVIPDVVTEAPTSNTGTRATLAGTVNPDGVELDECFFEWGEGVPGSPVYGNVAPCAQTPAEIGAGTTPVSVQADLTGLDPHGNDSGTEGGRYEYRLVAKNPNATVNGSNQPFQTPDTVIAEAASPITPTEATLNGTVNPDTATISECVFEWGPPKEPGEEIQKYPETAPCVPGPAGITGESPVAVEAEISGLEIGAVYHYRLKAAYPTKTVVVPHPGLGGSPPATLQTLGPVIAGTWSEDVVRTEGTLKAAVNPAGKATTYRFEWGTDTSYGNQTEELAVGSDSSEHELTRLLSGLTPGTAYHFRVVATNSDAENVGPDTTFTTYERPAPDTDCPNQDRRYGPSAKLPDCRAYEMVSPIDKAGGEIKSPASLELGRHTAHLRAAPGGDKITYTTGSSFGDILSKPGGGSQYLATRGASGWSNHGINAPQGTTINDPNFTALEMLTRVEAFTEDLSTAWVRDFNREPLAPGARAGVQNLYKRDNTDDTYEALSFAEPLLGSSEYRMAVKGISEDGSRTFVDVARPLTEDAAANTNAQVYEIADGELELISILPNGEADPAKSFVGTGNVVSQGAREDLLDHAVSADGSRVFWTSGASTFDSSGKIYIRIDGETTVPVSESVSTANAQFWGADPEGTKALFSIGNGLHDFDVDAETPTFIAGGVEGVLGTADDLSHVYFVSTEALGAGAVSGEANLYLHREGANEFIATIGSTKNSNFSNTGASPFHHLARVTADGRHVVFRSERSLTDYDNTDVTTGEAASELFVYDADSEELSCASCNPSGARPQAGHPDVPHSGIGAGMKPDSLLAAAWITTWEWSLNEQRPLSEGNGRLFFNSFDPLVPRDTNGVPDVYQWEERGAGGCTLEDPEYSEVNNGCVSLISTGQSAEWSQFVDASANGNSVFFRTASSIEPEDMGALDLYVARVGGGYPRAAEPIPCVGDACQNVPPPPDDRTPASATFRGAGDPVPRRNCGAVARRAAKLARRAKRLRRVARHSSLPRRSKRLRRRSVRTARSARRLSTNAKRCRRANRRAGR